MKSKTALQMNDLKSETNRSLSQDAERKKPDHPSRKPAVYRSVGIRVPGNDSLMVVHVTEH
jgi:hypothetical protein